MKTRILALILCAVAAAPLSGCSDSSGAGLPDPDQVVVFETSYGRIVWEFLPEYAPKHVAAFSQMIKDGFYDGTRFHRIIPGKVIQGGDPNSKDDDPSNDGVGQPGQPTIPAEFSTTMKHTRGIVSAARKGQDVNSATSQFFVCTEAMPAFDGQYSIFGRVIDGMNVVDIIAKATLNPTVRERPADPVTIKRAYLSTRAELGLPPKAAAPAT